MSAVGTRHIIWHGGEHDFCIAAVGNILALQQSCGAGLAEIYKRLVNGTWYLNDVRETIRLGMVGGGMSEADAMKAVNAFVDANPKGLAPSVFLAAAIIEAALIGEPDDPVGKKTAPEAETGQASTTTTAASGARQSTASAQA